MNPFASGKENRIDSIGESALIELMRDWLGTASPPTPKGIGDDCSAIPLPTNKSHLLTTADPVIYKRHFEDSLSPEQVAQLKRDYGIYLVNSGRINVCGITRDNVDYLSESIAAVL